MVSRFAFSDAGHSVTRGLVSPFATRHLPSSVGACGITARAPETPDAQPAPRNTIANPNFVACLLIVLSWSSTSRLPGHRRQDARQRPLRLVGPCHPRHAAA